MPSARRSWSRRRALPVLMVVVPPLPLPLTRTMPAPALRIFMAGKIHSISRVVEQQPGLSEFFDQGQVGAQGAGIRGPPPGW